MPSALSNGFEIFNFLILIIATLLVLLKSKYAQYLYFIVTGLLLVATILSLVLKSLYLLQHNSFAASRLLTVISMALPPIILKILVVMFLGVASRVKFDRPIQSERTKKILNLMIAITLGCLVWLFYLFSAQLIPHKSYIGIYDYGGKYAVLFFIMAEQLLWFTIFAGLPMLIFSSLIKNIKISQIAIASFVATLSLFGLVFRYGFPPDFYSWAIQIQVLRYLLSVIILLSTYYFYKKIQNRFISHKYLIGFE